MSSAEAASQTTEPALQAAQFGPLGFGFPPAPRIIDPGANGEFVAPVQPLIRNRQETTIGPAKHACWVLQEEPISDFHGQKMGSSNFMKAFFEVSRPSPSPCRGPTNLSVSNANTF